MSLLTRMPTEDDASDDGEKQTDKADAADCPRETDFGLELTEHYWKDHGTDA